MLITFTLLMLFVSTLLLIGVIRARGLWSIPAVAVSVFIAGFQFRALIIAISPELSFAGIPLSAPDLWQASQVGIISLAALCAPFFIGSIGRGQVRPSSNDAVRYGVPRPYAALAVAALILAVQFGVLSTTFGGVSSAISALSRRSIIGGVGFVTNFDLLYMPLIIYGVIASIKERRYISLAVCGGAFVALLPWIAVMKGRGMVLIAVIALGISFRFVVGRGPKGIFTAVGAVLSVASILGGLAWRMSSQTGSAFGDNIRLVAGKSGAVISSTIPILDHYAAGLEYARQTGHDYGYAILQAFTVLIPRAVWPDKPRYLPQLLGEAIYRNPTSGMPAGLLGEGHISFGLLGPIILSGLFGFFVAFADRVIRTKREWLVTAWLAYALISVVVGGLRTGAQAALMSLQISIPAFLLILFLSRFGGLGSAKYSYGRTR